MYNITEISERIGAMRDLCGYTIEEMAKATDTTVEEYENCEAGKKDFSFTFLYKCAEKFGIDMVELLTGENPHLTDFTVVHDGKGRPIRRRSGFEYFHLASYFKGAAGSPGGTGWDQARASCRVLRTAPGPASSATKNFSILSARTVEVRSTPKMEAFARISFSWPW